MGNNKKKLPDRMNITGRRFGRWLCLRYSGQRGAHRMFYCRCNCGVERDVPYHNLTKKISNGCSSCSNKTHGKSGTKLYQYWIHCKNRFNLCKRWSEDYTSFIEAIPERKRGFTLVAVDETKPIGPNNYRWVDTQKRRLELTNASATKHDINGVKMTARELQASLGISRQRAFQILYGLKRKCQACGKDNDRVGKCICSHCATRRAASKLEARIESTKAKLLGLKRMKAGTACP